jgi:hypothetical protein
MPLYHFDLVNTKTIADEGGAELPDDIDAIDCADGIARRILDERPFSTDRHYWILVANEDGNEFGPSRDVVALFAASVFLFPSWSCGVFE